MRDVIIQFKAFFRLSDDYKVTSSIVVDLNIMEKQLNDLENKLKTLNF